ncbi:PP2C family protein-serine/threonine phosphatase [Haliangium sp.]|uniref:PP2C family protein-serine/threonine phosphatase n=1 Tax=Haliangium sp. TaxID=2663208 RepID=UPI003D0CADB3
MSATQESAPLSWTKSILLLTPTVALWTAAALLGPDTELGFAGLLSGLTYLVLDLALIQPRLAKAPGARALALARQVAWYHDELIRGDGVELVPALLARLAHGLGSEERALVVVRTTQSNGDERIEAYPSPGAAVPDIAPELVSWAGSQTQVLDTAEAKPGSARANLLALTASHAALPLRWGSSGLGVAFVGGAGQALSPLARRAYEWMRMTTALAIQRRDLGPHIHDRSQLQGLVEYARATQEALMPDERANPSDGLLIHGMFRPAAQCGGDLWVWRSLGQGRVLVFLGDVTGHGVAPAMLSAAAAGAIQSFAIATGAALDPAALLGEVNRSLYRIARRRYMMTALAAVVDRQAGEIRYANAAQTFPYLVRPGPNADSEVELRALVTAGPMLGHLEDAHFPSAQVALAPGDKLFLYTDGLIEAERSPNQAYGARRLRKHLQALARHPGDRVAPSVLDGVYEFLRDARPDDDMTVVVVEWPPGPREV